MLTEFLRQNKEVILHQWFEQTIGTYQPQMARFLKKETNQFSNPVRNTIVTSLEKIYDGILSENDIESNVGLKDLIKVRAVQDFSPSGALSFLFDLKKIIRTEILKRPARTTSLNDLHVLDQWFDSILCRAFDYYNECRMKIQEIKISEIKSRSERAFKVLQKKNN